MALQLYLVMYIQYIIILKVVKELYHSNRCDWYSISINYTICSFKLACSNCFNWFCWLGYNDFRGSNGSYNLFILSRWNYFTIWIFFYFNGFIFNFSLIDSNIHRMIQGNENQFKKIMLFKK